MIKIWPFEALDLVLQCRTTRPMFLFRFLSICLAFWFFDSCSHVGANGVFKVQHRFVGREWSLGNLKDHDGRRHRRFLGAVDIPLGGNGHPAETGLYFGKIGLGSPPKDYYVQVDTGSDILWVNCIQCTKCPKKSDIGIQLTLFDPKDSTTSNTISCDEQFCTTLYDQSIPGCVHGMLCEYRVVYGDGSTTNGYYVRDYVHYNQATGNLKTSTANSSIIFGSVWCGARQSGDLGSSNEALDGILGFGQANSSMISQIAASGKVKKVFSHCLDGVNGGGIFAIGEVVQPKVKTTPLVPNQPHYNVNLKEIVVGKTTLDLPSDAFETGDRKGTIIDSGTTLAYLSEVVFEPFINEVFSRQPNMKFHTVEEQFSCFRYSGSVDEGFPTVTFNFENSLPLIVYPHEYFFQIAEDEWCIGWQNSGLQSREGKYMTLLGGSSSIKLKDEKSGAVYAVGAHDLSSASTLYVEIVMIALFDPHGCDVDTHNTNSAFSECAIRVMAEVRWMPRGSRIAPLQKILATCISQIAPLLKAQFVIYTLFRREYILCGGGPMGREGGIGRGGFKRGREGDVRERREVASGEKGIEGEKRRSVEAATTEWE
ncbi:hypothetical protein Sjap_006056 [Stephania japonica]|uniref:Peptidase A1 domain-containing protein n=1 Tax=Stephania japonica TaxID=461633 RepID=A0AAP0PIJ7_9MAGN